MHIGKNIAKIRELLGIKQESLALTLKISQQTISKIEQTENLRENTVERIANALGISTSMIYKYSDQLLIDFLKEAISGTDLPKAQASVQLPVLEKIIELYERILLMEKGHSVNLQENGSKSQV
jgi:transcriptional regulator with XRE-family HTH domain